MKKKITVSLFWLLFCIVTDMAAQCTTGTKYPVGIHQATGPAGSDVINTDARTGQYTDVHIEPSKYYSFSSSVSTDYITITNSTGSQIIAAGVTPVNFVSQYNQTVRYYLHQNAQCQTTNQFVRSRTVTWVTAQACLNPTPTNVTNISPISCTLNYTVPATAPYFGYEAYVSTSADTPGLTVPTSDSTTNSILVTSLNPDTTYHYWIRSDCDYQKGAWIYGGTFTTISSLLCNSAYHGIYPSVTITPDCTGSDEYFATNVKNSSFSNIAVVPNTQYTFRTNHGTDFITITNATGTVVLASGSTPVSWNSAATSGVVRFYSHDNAQCGYGISVAYPRNKYVKCTTASVTCLPPSALTVANITSNSIRMSWTAPSNLPSSGYDILMTTTNTTPTASTPATYTNTTTTREINGLTAGVTYYYWVRSNCGNEKSSWTSGGFFTMNPSFTCNGAIYGLFPEATFTPACTGNAEVIANNAFAGQFSNVNLNANQSYIFSSSVATDYITITDNTGTSILASGFTPLNWSSGNNSGTVRYYLHANSNCGSQNTNRIKYMQCAVSASCGVPSQLTVANITSNSCRLNWAAPATAPTNYEIYIITTNTAPTSTTTATLTSNTVGVGALNGLSAATTYYYWIRSNCNGAKSAWVTGGSFTTPAALTCNGALYGLYPSATFIPTCTGSPQQIVADAYAGEYSNVSVVSNTQYTFFSSNSADFITVTDALGNTVLASGTTPLNWVSGTYAGIVRYHINTNASCGTQNTNRVRYIQCLGLTTCTPPSNVSVSNITSNSCRVAWSAPNPAPTGYEVYYSTSSTAPTIGTIGNNSTAATSINALSILDPATTYYIWVRSNCSGTKSIWVAGPSFTTVAALTCNSAFYGLYPSNTYTPACSGSAEPITTNAFSGEYSNVNITNGKLYTFTSSVGTDYITITNASGSVVLASGLSPLSWNSNFSGVIRYFMHSNANCGNQGIARVKSITCSTVTTCNAPGQIYYDGLTATTNTLAWVAPTPAPSNGYSYAYGTVNDLFHPSTITGNTSATFVNIANLTPNTTYYFWVKSNCGNSQSNWSLGNTFTTYALSTCNVPTQLFTDPESATVVNIAWVEPTPTPSNGYSYAYGTVNDPFHPSTITGSTANTFAVLTNLTPNTTYYFWVRSNCGNYQSNWAPGGSFTTGAASTCNAPGQIYYDGLTATTNTLAWVAPIPAPSNGYSYAYGTVNDPFHPSTTTGNTSATFVEIFNLTPNTTYYFWVKSNCGNSQSNWAPGGSFTTPAASTCNLPTQLFTDPESATVVNIAWVAPIPAPSNGYSYAYGTVNDPFHPSTITGTTSDTFAVLTNLTPNTTYYFWVKSNCGNSQSNWAPGGSFTTAPASSCNVPTQLFTDPESQTVVNIAWVAPIPAPSNGYSYAYGTVNDPFHPSTITGNTSNTFAVLSNLTPNTIYYFWVKSNCGNSQSNWAPGGSFTTQNLSNNTVIKNKVILYPNPAKTNVTIQLDQTITTVTVHNLLGQEVLSKTVQAKETTLDLAHLTAGNYFVKITTENTSTTVKIIKE